MARQNELQTLPKTEDYSKAIRSRKQLFLRKLEKPFRKLGRGPSAFPLHFDRLDSNLRADGRPGAGMAVGGRPSAAAAALCADTAGRNRAGGSGDLAE